MEKKLRHSENLLDVCRWLTTSTNQDARRPHPNPPTAAIAPNPQRQCWWCVNRRGTATLAAGPRKFQRQLPPRTPHRFASSNAVGQFQTPSQFQRPQLRFGCPQAHEQHATKSEMPTPLPELRMDSQHGLAPLGDRVGDSAHVPGMSGKQEEKRMASTPKPRLASVRRRMAWIQALRPRTAWLPTATVAHSNPQ